MTAFSQTLLLSRRLRAVTKSAKKYLRALLTFPMLKRQQKKNRGNRAVNSLMSNNCRAKSDWPRSSKKLKLLGREFKMCKCKRRNRPSIWRTITKKMYRLNTTSYKKSSKTTYLWRESFRGTEIITTNTRVNPASLSFLSFLFYQKLISMWSRINRGYSPFWIV